jgi:hypothetical protein
MTIAAEVRITSGGPVDPEVLVQERLRRVCMTDPTGQHCTLIYLSRVPGTPGVATCSRCGTIFTDLPPGIQRHLEWWQSDRRARHERVALLRRVRAGLERL